MPDIGWRQINEFASKKDSIEFFARYRDEYKSKHPRITIDMVVFALPSEKDAKDMRDAYKRKHPFYHLDLPSRDGYHGYSFYEILDKDMKPLNPRITGFVSNQGTRLSVDLDVPPLQKQP